MTSSLTRPCSRLLNRLLNHGFADAPQKAEELNTIFAKNDIGDFEFDYLSAFFFSLSLSPVCLMDCPHMHRSFPQDSPQGMIHWCYTATYILLRARLLIRDS